jgi:N-acetylmuramoyl-L-alanine amidase
MIKNVILDFGHGGLDASGNYTTYPSKMYDFGGGDIAYEGVLNREIGQKVLECFLEVSSLNVECTVCPDDPTDLGLHERVEVANKYDPNETICISVHCNAGGGTGFELFTTRGETDSDDLAECIADSVEPLYEKMALRLRYDFSDGDKDKEADFFVLTQTKCPAVLLECGFFDNKTDYLLLKDQSFQSDLACLIFNGILNYINKHR